MFYFYHSLQSLCCGTETSFSNSIEDSRQKLLSHGVTTNAGSQQQLWTPLKQKLTEDFEAFAFPMNNSFL